ncbi:protein-methionine-sulfoxide reductase heme-binding subunit MsrQ [Rhodobacteraceae bacterium R_SAG10]|nr:protein-methionine-sulfoxide reductase heme-binding subunit MsrQ [Rhodobacteraceae bacterium R_SAG10]
MSYSQTINSALRRVPAWPLYFIAVVPAFWFLYLGLTGGRGAEPIKALEQELGRFALKLLIVAMAITPLRMATGVSLIKYRRALGLVVVFYISMHLLVWLVLDVQNLGRVWADIVKRPYITIGMTAFALMIPLAITSNNWSIRKMGPVGWKRLHWLTYLIIVLGAVHFVMLRKAWQIQPLIYLGIALALLAMRLKWKQMRARARVSQQ